MRAGLLRNRITIQQKVIEKDNFGQNIDQWVDVCNVRAEIRDKSGGEYQSSQSEQSQTDCKILIRRPKNITITPDMRVLCNGIYYDITAVLEDVKKTRLELPCKKGVRYD